MSPIIERSEAVRAPLWASLLGGCGSILIGIALYGFISGDLAFFHPALGWPYTPTVLLGVGAYLAGLHTGALLTQFRPGADSP